MIRRFVYGTSPHKHELRGGVQMKEYMDGNTKIVIHSDFINKTEEEKKVWFEQELAAGNPVLKAIEEAVLRCYES